MTRIMILSIAQVALCVGFVIFMVLLAVNS